MPLTTVYANKVLDYIFGKSSLTRPTAVYIALSANDPEADNGTFNEISGDTYERVLLMNNEGDTNLMGNASERTITNTKQINWTKATAEWAEANGFGIYTAKTGGELLYYGKLDTPVKVAADAVALFDPGTLKISFATVDTNAVV